MTEEKKRLVWDLPLRVFHWLFGLSILASWATGEGGYDWMQIHFWLGYWIIGLLVFRVLWGIVGPRHARFVNFLPSPARLWSYTKGIVKGESLPSVGHNPLGSLMVVVMLVLVAIQAGTGLFTTDDIIWSGPYNAAADTDTAKFLTRLHHSNFDWILIAVGLHILAIVFYWFVKKQNLVVPMFTGRKPAEIVPPHEAIQHSELIKAAIVIVLSVALVYWLISSAPPPPADEFLF